MRVVLFGDESGLRICAESVPMDSVVGVVRAWNRPAAEEAVSFWRKRGLACLIQPKRKDLPTFARFREDLIQLNPDIILVNSYGLILPKELLDIPTKGGFNVHVSALPLYRGANVLNWVLINGEVQTGITLHKMVEEVDAGAIVLQRSIPIEIDDTAVTLRNRMSRANQKLIQEAWPLLERDPVPMEPQDEDRATVFRRRKPEDGRFQWSWPVIRIYNLIRALVTPWPGAFYEVAQAASLFTDSGTVNIHRALSLNEVTSCKYREKAALKGDDVSLCPLQEEDIQHLYAQINDRSLALFGAPYRLVTEGQHRVPPFEKGGLGEIRVWYEAIQQRNDVIAFSIRLPGTGKLIGLCQLHNINYVHRSAELQVRLANSPVRRDSQSTKVRYGQRYRTEAVRLMLDFAHRDLNLNRVYLCVLSTDTMTLRVYEKSGFVREGVLRKAANIGGEYVDVVVMGILREGEENAG